MNYIDQGNAIGQNSFARKSTKKTSLFFQQAQRVKEEERYVRKVDDLIIFKDSTDLVPFKQHFKLRNDKFFETIEQIIKLDKSLLEFAKGYTRLGFQLSDIGISYKEYAPAAKKVYLYGEFNDLKKEQYECEQIDGLWELLLPSGEIKPNQAIQVHLQDSNDQLIERNPIWANNSKLNKEGVQEATLWFPDYAWKHKTRPRPLNIKVSEYDLKQSYADYTKDQIPKIYYQGYNTILIKHSVTELIFAPNPKLGTPQELQELIDTAHGSNLYVILELNHNIYPLPVKYDGSELYGKEGRFDYTKYEVLRLLLSNIEWWIRVYQIDGFIMKNVSQIIYGDSYKVFQQSLNLEQYFGDQTNIDGLVYLMLATDLVKQISDNIVIISDDDLGYPTLCKPIHQGGVGFDLNIQDLCFNIIQSMEQILEEEAKI